MENILIIDDDIKLTDLLIEFLSSHKYNVIAKMVDFTKDEKLGGTMILGSYSIHLKKKSLILS